MNFNEIHIRSICIELESLCGFGWNCEVICLNVNEIWASDWPTLKPHLKVLLFFFSHKDYLVVFIRFDFDNFIFNFNSLKNCGAFVSNYRFCAIHVVCLFWHIQSKILVQNRSVVKNRLIPFYCEFRIVYVCNISTIKVRNFNWWWIVLKKRIARGPHVFFTCSKFFVAREVKNNFLVTWVSLWNIFCTCYCIHEFAIGIKNWEIKTGRVDIINFYHIACRNLTDPIILWNSIFHFNSIWYCCNISLLLFIAWAGIWINILRTNFFENKAGGCSKHQRCDSVLLRAKDKSYLIFERVCLPLQFNFLSHSKRPKIPSVWYLNKLLESIHIEAIEINRVAASLVGYDCCRKVYIEHSNPVFCVDEDEKWVWDFFFSPIKNHTEPFQSFLYSKIVLFQGLKDCFNFVSLILVAIWKFQ